MNNDPAVVAPSSIALLQERFRQLHRVKQMREERELLKLLSLSSHFPTALPVGTFFWHPELMIIAPSPTTTPPQTSLSLSPIPQPNKFRLQLPPLVCLWPAPHTINPSPDHTATSFIRIHDDDDDNDDSDSYSDVDTSLHL